MSLLTRVSRSAAYRSSALYRRLLRALPAPRLREKPALPLTFVTFGGAAHRQMVAQTLFSLGRTWPRLPRVQVVSDGSLDPAADRAALSWWPGDLEVLSWRDLVPDLLARGHQDLVRFAERDAMGKKMAAVVAYAAEGPTLYCDCDVLWFRLPERLETLLRTPAPCLVMSEDYLATYDPALVPSRLPELATPPFYCAGLLYAEGDLLAGRGLEPLLAEAAERGIGVTEQTLLAAADRRLGGACWPRTEIALFEDDRFSLAPSYPRRDWVARHYIGQVRHLFWRDALALRLGIGSTAEGGR